MKVIIYIIITLAFAKFLKIIIDCLSEDKGDDKFYTQKEAEEMRKRAKERMQK